jgi:hypothetical protein
MKRIILLATVLGLGLYSVDSSAQLFRLRVSNAGSLNPTQQATLEASLRSIEEEINKEFPSPEDPKRLMEGMANSSVMAGKGIGSDYASRMKVFMIGAGVGLGADLEKDKTTDSNLSGVGVQGGIIIGTNLGWMDTQKILGLQTDRLNLYANYLGYNLDRKMGDAGNDQIEAKLKSFGLHASYDLVRSKGSSLLRWGGIKVHTGYEYNSTELTFKTTLKENVSATLGGGVSASGTLTGNPAASIDVSTQSIPLEISTNIQLLYLLSLYTGIGADFNFGDAKSKGALNAGDSPVLINGANTGTTVTADANIQGKGKVNPVLTRAFAGVQFNLPYINIFVQADKALGNDLVGATAGVRIVY